VGDTMESSPLFRKILSCVSIRQRLLEQEGMIGCEFDIVSDIVIAKAKATGKRKMELID
jgi:hypothetical protein